MKSEELKERLERLQKELEDAQYTRDCCDEDLEHAQDAFDNAEDAVERLGEEIYDLEDELEEALAEEEAGDEVELERYYAARDKRQEDLDL
jgi:chromosome segregation ATPase